MRRARRKRAEVGPLTGSQRDLAGRYWPLAIRLVLRCRRPGARPGHLDGAMDAASLALVVAARDYREPSPIRFATFARWKIAREVARALSTPSPSLSPFPRLADPRDDFARVDARDAAEAILRRIGGREAEAVRLVVVEEETLAAAGRSLGCSATLARRLVARGLAALKNGA